MRAIQSFARTLEPRAHTKDAMFFWMHQWSTRSSNMSTTHVNVLAVDHLLAGSIDAIGAIQFHGVQMEGH